jgi:hypothetical protein
VNVLAETSQLAAYSYCNCQQVTFVEAPAAAALAAAIDR